ncbi:excinuclease ABC subunit C [Pontibacter sp. BT310]|uniref:UvrABC system protein C n=1 Tax=Pontibacter populi TaxID=890055 RepID=A0ABS6XAY7_9BACT|nr:MULTISPECIES: excinuclease ABC subunit UvrC [Pontibacter]MBJ6117786.1 excinuclease ABC subunit C [Pontibacter sp. BT310]MBR0570212.1 excinuclease ABC subunit C [Microvirga sp. STS03]MBW3364638.1 excinuclease ABC subunit UvrC [Pontibacter populi]
MPANEKLKETISHLPHKPGIYKFFDEKGIIYVGKAVDIRKRVSSYFNRSAQHNKKTLKLVSQIKDIEFTIVDTEADAFLLENNLIKQYQPKYNILLKDGKTYPYICIVNERFPRVISTRNKINDGSRYFGPYPSGTTMHVVLDLIRTLYPLRTCTYNLSPENIAAGKFKVCLEYHIGNCKGPCEALVDETTYNHYISQIRSILSGNLTIAKNYFKEHMAAAAAEFQFELAHQYKQKLDMLEDFQVKSTVVSNTLTNIDVFTITSNEQCAFLNYLKVMNGSIILTQSLEIQKKLDEADEDILASVIVQLRQEFESTSREVITNIEVALPLDNITVTYPQIGDKRKLLNLSLKNAMYLRREREGRQEKNRELSDQREIRVLEIMKKDLRLTELPRHIECFDNSNFQGDNPVASMVCFKNGRPSKKDYRHFNIKTVVGPNDFESMYEIVTRRYRRLLDETQPLPQLIIIDGGKGQLSFAVKALKDLDIWGKVAIVGIAKRLEEIFYPGDNLPLYIDKKSESLRLIQRIRDEAHRFAITFHRSKRDAGTLKTELTDIKGIGPVISDQLLNKYRSVKKLRELTLEELTIEIGKAKATILYNYLHTSEKL